MSFNFKWTWCKCCFPLARSFAIANRSYKVYVWLGKIDICSALHSDIAQFGNVCVVMVYTIGCTKKNLFLFSLSSFLNQVTIDFSTFIKKKKPKITIRFVLCLVYEISFISYNCRYTESPRTHNTQLKRSVFQIALPDPTYFRRRLTTKTYPHIILLVYCTLYSTPHSAPNRFV